MHNNVSVFTPMFSVLVSEGPIPPMRTIPRTSPRLTGSHTYRGVGGRLGNPPGARAGDALAQARDRFLVTQDEVVRQDSDRKVKRAGRVRDDG
jgi:hypothetical protein